MATLYPLPDGTRVKTMLGMLFDGLDVKPGQKLDTTPAGGAYFAVFIADDGKPVALCGCDTQFAAYASGALSMLPPGIAQEAAKTKQLTEVMLANLHEIMNICTRLLLTDASPHLKLAQIHPAKSLPADAAAVVGGAKGRVDFDIGVAKYGRGTLSVMSL
jgi:hypothetical protein